MKVINRYPHKGLEEFIVEHEKKQYSVVHCDKRDTWFLYLLGSAGSIIHVDLDSELEHMLKACVSEYANIV